MKNGSPAFLEHMTFLAPSLDVIGWLCPACGSPFLIAADDLIRKLRDELHA